MKSASAWPWARQTDILQQFLIEAVLVCMIGGLFGFLPARNAARLDPIDALDRE